jgi:hypothetical protein
MSKIIFSVAADMQGKAPRWVGTAHMDQNGTVYAAAAMVGNELAVTLAAMFDGTPTVLYRRHVFLPVNWIAENYPDWAEICAAILRRVKAEFSAQ